MTRPLGVASSLLWPVPLVKVVQQVAEAGFTRLEISVDHLRRDTERPCDTAAVSIHASGRGVSIWSVHLPFGRAYELGDPKLADDEVHARYVDAFEKAYTLGASQVIVHPTDLARVQHPVRPTLELVGTRFARLLEECARRDLQMAIESMLPHLIGGRVEELLWLYDHLPPERLGLCLDFGHAALGRRLPLTIRSLRGRIISTHLHDNHRSGDEHLLPGDGATDWRQAIDMLDEIGYAGPLMLEPAPREVTVEGLVEIRERMERLLNSSA